MKIPNYSNYEIYPNEGKIFSLKSKRFIGSKDKDGYYRCSLCADDGTVWNSQLHRVIWTAVNGTIPSDMQVNHIDENKENNSISNLNLMTPKENINYGTRNERMAKSNSKQVGAFKDGELIMTFPNAIEAKKNGFTGSHICNCCNGIRKSHKGFQW